jgi:hypothetical protein
MAYKLYLDKPEEFMCEMAVKNASMKDAFARMVVKTDNLTLMFEGQLKDGKCSVPIRRLKGILDENTKGKMHLEVIVEDTYFQPWQDDFVIEEHTSVKVKVEEQVKPKSKPSVVVKSMTNILTEETTKKKLSTPAQDMMFICEKMGITKSNLVKKQNDFKAIVKEYFKASPEFVKNSKKYITETVSSLK